MTHRGESVLRFEAASASSRDETAMNLTDTSELRTGTTTIAPDRTIDLSDRDRSVPGLESAANWLWVAPDAGRACALVVGEISRAYRRGLSARFERVEQIPVAALKQVAASVDGQSQFGVQLPYEDGSVDCVVSTDLVNHWPWSRHSPFRDARFVTVLAELRRLLRANGVLFLGGRNARWYRAWLLLRAEEWASTRQAPCTRPFLPVGAARGALAGAGFSEIRAYFVEPSIADPLTIVPASRRAALAYERSRWPRHNVLLRSLSAAGGVYQFLYPDAFVLGIK
jgi:SAM-dependent methyltransferase